MIDNTFFGWIPIIIQHLIIHHSLFELVCIEIIVIVVLIYVIVLKNNTTKKLKMLAYTDSLTGLQNRAGFHEKITNTIHNIQKVSAPPFILVLVDIDNFKKINDTRGHLVGDACLVSVANRMSKYTEEKCICSINNKSECYSLCSVFRLGGDEFVFICNYIDDTSIEFLAQEILDFVSEPIPISTHIQNHKNHVIKTSISMGISIYGKDGYDVTSLLKSADLALYWAKKTGKNTFRMHKNYMDKHILLQTKCEEILYHLIETKDFVIHYQPIVDINSGKMLGAEALIRIDMEKFPDTSISTLLTVAETGGLIVPLGHIILEKIFNDVSNMLNKYPDFVVSINISVLQIEREDDLNWLIHAMIKHDIPPENITIEITETTFMYHFNKNVKKIEKMKEMGFTIALDDFGKGYSSMLYLKDLPVSKIKIDKSFMSDLADEQNIKTKEIVRAIILVVRALGLISCAEGVETYEQLHILKRLGCDQIQGFIDSEAISIDALLGELKLQETNERPTIKCCKLCYNESQS